MRKNPIYGVESVEWKTCNTDTQACAWCGHLLDKSYIEILLKGVQGKKKVNLWVHAGCSYEFGVAVEMTHPQLMCARINKWRPDGKRRCLVCDKIISKNKEAVAWLIDNSADHIKIKKSLVLHDRCRQKLADGFKDPLL